MSKQFEIEVERVNGYCSCGYKVGDVVSCEGLNTPNQPFCGGAYGLSDSLTSIGMELLRI